VKIKTERKRIILHEKTKKRKDKLLLVGKYALANQCSM
jgi:hypothetical protein